MEFDEDYMVWADSFKEGEWIINLILSNDRFKLMNMEYKFNFQPIFYVKYNEKVIRFTIYGGYSAWDNKPPIIEKFLSLSRPDVMIYNIKKDKLVFSIEETAAVPTGNQSLQRLERVWWAAELKIPFVYLITEYGMHKDGNLRKNSIWPAYLGLKLSCQYKTPSLTLLFGDKTHPEDYDYGFGVNYLCKLVELYILKELDVKVDSELKEVLSKIILEMNKFILSHKDNISNYLPGSDILDDNEFIQYVVENVT